MRATEQIVGLVLSAFLGGGALQAAPPASWSDPPELEGLKFRSVGPALGGRVTRVAGVPGDPLTSFVATAGGGLWRSLDGGVHFSPVFDGQPTATIGAIAVAPSDRNVVYAGSGEANIRGNVEPGNGIYRSTDGGTTWKQVWTQKGQIGALAVDPRNADVAVAAVLGHAFGPNAERGVYRTTDGGRSWKRVLFVDEATGASDVAIDATNPRILFAGLWQARRTPWSLTSGGPGSGLYRSSDGGESWTRLAGKGLPEGIWGKVGVAVAPSDGRRVYALIEAEQGGLFRSDDGGATWSLANAHHVLRQRAWYYTTLTVDPTNPDVVWFPQVRLLRSIDGGRTVQPVKGPHHGDHHDVWIDPRDPRRMIDGNDGGVDLSLDGGASWRSAPLPISQVYRLAVDRSRPFRIAVTMQDIGSAVGPSRSLTGEGIPIAEWTYGGGGEAGDIQIDANDPNVVWAGEYGGYLSRADLASGELQNVSVYPFNSSGHGAVELRHRFQWTAPILLSPHDPRTVYHGAERLFRTRDGGATWTAISPDLTRNDPGKQQWSGGPITGDNTGVEVYGTLFALAESPLVRGLLWVGSDDGRVHLSRDDGATWEDLTPRLPGFPEWGTVRAIEASPHAPGTAWVVASAYRLDDDRPYLWRTTDFGRTWTSLTATLPSDLFLHCLREDPRQPGLLYLGTERGLALSRDGGASWRPLRANLPTVAVADLEVAGDALVLGTHGRSVWVLDDLTPVRLADSEVARAPVTLFPPTPAVRWRSGLSWAQVGASGAGENPPNGASIWYRLTAPVKEARLEILDAGGLVRTLRSDVSPAAHPPDDPDQPTAPPEPALDVAAGLHRAVWDLRAEGTPVIPRAKLDAGDPETGPRVPPGRYRLRLVADGASAEADLVVERDPRSRDGDPAIAERYAFARALRDDLSRVADAVARVRAIDEQLAPLAARWLPLEGARELLPRVEALRGRCREIEGRLHNPQAQVVYDILAQRGGAQLYSQLAPLAEWVADADSAPTQGMREVAGAHHERLAALEREIAELESGPLAALLAEAAARRIPIVALPPRDR